LFETDLENLILDYLNRQKGWFCWKNYSTGIYDPKIKSFRNRSKFGPSGISDIIGIYTGILIAIEVKLPGNKLTDKQLAFIERINKLDGEATWVDSLDKAIAFVQKVERKYGLAEKTR